MPHLLATRSPSESQDEDAVFFGVYIVTQLGL